MSANTVILPLYCFVDESDFRGPTLDALRRCAGEVCTDVSEHNGVTATALEEGYNAHVGQEVRLPFFVPLTGYWLLNVFVVVSLGTVKFVMTLHGYSLAPTVLDWAITVPLAIA